MLRDKLVRLPGVSGEETAVRNLILQEIKDLGLTPKIDALGNVVVKKPGRSPREILLVAHMDEVGLMVSEIDSAGLIKFLTVGPLDLKQWVSKRVLIGKDEVPGVIGAKPIHLQKAAERKEMIGRKSLYIDIGASSKDEAEGKVSRGDFVSLAVEGEAFGDRKWKGKALDSRLPIEALLELLKGEHEASIVVAFTVMRLIGGRGAIPVSWGTKPDEILILDGIDATDSPDHKGRQSKIILGKGPCILIKGTRAIMDRKMRNGLEKAAKKAVVSVQSAVHGTQYFESNFMQLVEEGRKVGLLGLPIRYMHSPVAVCDERDLQGMKALLTAWVSANEKEEA
ncbi:M42 family metallopeptidase [Gottschalkiaceae bacterium SANA]|nr:M42 family metallopeptidase [Gottschalkiaceae bacterium SANA]